MYNGKPCFFGERERGRVRQRVTKEEEEKEERREFFLLFIAYSVSPSVYSEIIDPILDFTL
jgi:hypothetical protein